MEIVVPEEYRRLYVRDAQHPVYKVPDPVLRKVAAPVEKLTKKTSFLVDELLKAMRGANGVGLAAPQMGVSRRILVMQPPDERPAALINPRVLRSEGSQIGVEGCLSIPGLYGDVERAEFVEIEALDRKGRELVFELEGLPARIALHEIDHLDGILFTDRAIGATLHWMDPDEFERTE